LALCVSDAQHTETDAVLEALERWKKRLIAAFLLISLFIALTAVLLFELGGVIKVWKLESEDVGRTPPTAMSDIRMHPELHLPGARLTSSTDNCVFAEPITGLAAWLR
jgi:hypothetical protein